MGSSFSWFPSAPESSADPSRLPEGVKKVNDSLYELYSPEGTPEVEIIFFHGLQVSDYKDAYWRTWSRDGKTIWPQTLLAKVLSQARILAVSYDSCAQVTETTGRMDMFQIGENLVGDIILSISAFLGRGRPVILVGHSLGGLVIKEFLMRADEMRHRAGEAHIDSNETISNFIGNLKGVFYYSTPHGGTRLADVVEKLPGNNGDVLRFLKILSKDSARLNDRFRVWRQGNKIPAFSIAESYVTNLQSWGVNFIVVPEASTRQDTDGYYTVAADHINVCKPENTRQGTFHFLYSFIQQNVPTLTTVDY